MKLEDLDIIIMSDQSFWSRLINFFVGKWSHCVVVTEASSNLIVHADGGEVRRETLDELLTRCPSYKLKVLRVRKGTEFSKRVARRWLYEQIGKEYDIPNAIGRGIYRLLSWFGVKRDNPSLLDNPNKYICSELIGAMFDYQGLEVLKTAHYTQLEPGDLQDAPFLEEVK